MPLPPHPYLENQVPVITGRLQHAPSSFRTVTMALDYVRSNFFLQTNQTPYRLPWSHPQDEVTIEQIVIHCLPGIYAPWKSGDQDPIDPKSGLPYNGETFPLGGNTPPVFNFRGIPPGVSIQGTSALDTIFDGRGRDGEFNHIFLFDVTAPESPVTHEDSFIDSVTIRNARSGSLSLPPDGAGIAIFSESKVQCTISNCFITDCDAGIAIDAYWPNPTRWLHSPVIVNNTFAFNRIGIFSGHLRIYLDPYNNPPGPGDWRGFARPRCFNNILDPRDPDGQFNSTVCFEGLHPSDLIIQTIAGNTINIDYNAYCQNASWYNQGLLPPYWINTVQPTSPRGAGPFSYGPPRFDLAPYMFSGGNQTSILYVNDTFRVLQLAGSNRTSRSPHDFRLTPMAQVNDGNSFFPNNLVNKGMDTSLGTLRFANYYTGNPLLTPDISAAPGLPLAVADIATFHAWDWDGEGFGNPRIEVRADFPEPPANSTSIDLGARRDGHLDHGRFHRRHPHLQPQRPRPERRLSGRRQHAGLLLQ